MRPALISRAERDHAVQIMERAGFLSMDVIDAATELGKENAITVEFDPRDTVTGENQRWLLIALVSTIPASLIP